MIVASRHLKTARQLLPAAMLFAGLVLGGPSLTEDVSFRSSSATGGTGLGVGGSDPDCPPRGCIHTGTNENLFDPSNGLGIIAVGS